METEKKINILVVDDHIIVRRGLIQILKEAYRNVQITEASEANTAMILLRQNLPDIAVLDISLPGRSGLDLLKDIKNLYPHLPVLILSIYPEDQYAIRVIKAGASGYLNKDRAPEEMIEAVQTILQGKKYLTRSLAEKIADTLYQSNHNSPHELLSDREFQVFMLIAQGKTVSGIAELLSLSVNTISTYRVRILDKLELTNNAEISKYALDNKLL